MVSRYAFVIRSQDSLHRAPAWRSGHGTATEETDETAPEEQWADPASSTAAIPIVGIGASAGGSESFTHLLQGIPVTTGLAFVLVQHLDPTHESILPELLSRVTRMPVQRVRDGMVVETNQIYVSLPTST